MLYLPTWGEKLHLGGYLQVINNLDLMWIQDYVEKRVFEYPSLVNNLYASAEMSFCVIYYIELRTFVIVMASSNIPAKIKSVTSVSKQSWFVDLMNPFARQYILNANLKPTGSLMFLHKDV